MNGDHLPRVCCGLLTCLPVCGGSKARRAPAQPGGGTLRDGLLAVEALLDLCVDMLVRPTRIRRASQGPQGRVVPFGGARQGQIVGYVLQLAAPTGPSPYSLGV